MYLHSLLVDVLTLPPDTVLETEISSERDWIAHSGWTFNRAALEPYYERAQKVCCAGPVL